MLGAPRNLGHRTILATLYATGARVSEVAQLQIPDIDSARNIIRIRGKGNKERQVQLSPNCWNCSVPIGAGRDRRIVIPWREAGKAAYLHVHFTACQKAAKKGGYLQTRSSAFSAPCLRYASAGIRSGLANHSDPDGSRQPGDHGPLFARHRHCGTDRAKPPGPAPFARRPSSGDYHSA